MCELKRKVPPPPPPPSGLKSREVRYGSKWDATIFTTLMVVGILAIVFVKIFGGV